jgi:uncharacterized delta-60 repeat protein
MRHLLITAGVAAALGFAAPARAAPGELDAGFATGGVFTASPFATQLDSQQQVGVDATGRTLMAMTEDSVQNGGQAGNVLVVGRLTTGGAPDLSFDAAGPTPGTKLIDFGAEIAVNDFITAKGIATAPDGSIVVLANVVDPSYNSPRIALVRLNPDGSYDSSLDGNGRLVRGFPPPDFNPYAQSLLVDGSGRMLVAGTETVVGCIPCRSQGFVARFTTAGVLDATWAGDGSYQYGGGTSSDPAVQFFALAFTAAGGVVVSGDRDLDAIVVKLGAGGTPDVFGTGGVATSDFAKGPGFSIATGFAVAVDSAGRVLLGGQMTPDAGAARAAITRFTPTGAPDSAWGDGTPAGALVYLPALLMARVMGLLVATDDKVVAAGTGSADPDGPGGASAQNAPSIARLTAAGVMDTTFGTGGGTITALGDYSNGYGVVADPVSSRLLEVAMRRLSGLPYDVRPVVLAYHDDASTSPPPTTTTTTTTAEPPPAPAPAATVLAAPAPLPAAAPVHQAAAPKLSTLVTFPPTKTCASRRKFGIRLRVPRGSPVVSASVKVNGEQVAVRKGSRLRSTVNLVKLPKGRFSVSIALKLADGRVVTGTRRYRTCVPKRNGGRPHV